jgi:predicted GNAT superfamily acetyltransferase
MSEILLRDLTGMDEFRAAEDLQRAVWGQGDQPDPADLMMVLQAEGGLVGGAFVDGRLMGYVFGFPTATPGVQHSHRLAVLAEARGLGLGLKLKFYQRDWCLARGISLVRWTFDPLRLPNAALNIHRLGGGSGTYLPDYYGQMAGINHGIASDRLLVDWNLASPTVAARARGETDAIPAGDALEIPLVPDLDALMATDMAKATAERLALRTALQTRFAKGQRIIGFDKAQGRYLMG